MRMISATVAVVNTCGSWSVSDLWIRGRSARAAAIGGMGTEEISEWLQGGSCTQDLHA